MNFLTPQIKKSNMFNQHKIGFSWATELLPSQPLVTFNRYLIPNIVEAAAIISEQSVRHSP